MTTGEYPRRLCGGTFFTLLLQAVKQRSKTRDRHNGGSDGLSAPDVLIGLIRLAQPQYMYPAASTFTQNTSAYKSCSISTGTYLPFNDPAFTSPFDMEVRTKYSNALVSISGFVDRFIDTENTAKYERLVKAIIEVIEADESITDSDAFYICADGQPMNKAAIRYMADICLQPFLLGVWHYIVINRPDNVVGRSTFEQWHEEPNTKGKQWRFIGRVGESITRPINIRMLESEATETSDEQKATAEVEPSVDCEPGAEDTRATSQAVNTPFVFKHYGNNNVIGDGNTQVTHADNINNVYNIILPGSDQSNNNTAFSSGVRLSSDYYNLFVIGDEYFDGGNFIVPKDRALTECVTPEIFEEFASLSDDAIEQIMTFPSLFASENHMYARTDDEHEAYFGVVTDVRIQENGIKIYFQIFSTVPQQKLNEMASDLALHRASSVNELDQTHWAIKKINLLEKLSTAGIRVLAAA